MTSMALNLLVLPTLALRFGRSSRLSTNSPGSSPMIQHYDIRSR
jgi:hypothetical protein